MSALSTPTSDDLRRGLLGALVRDGILPPQIAEAESAFALPRRCVLTIDCMGEMRLQQSPFSSAEWACPRCGERRLACDDGFERPEVAR